QHTRLRIDLDPTKSECNAAAYRVGLEWWRLDWIAPVRSFNREPYRAATIPDIGIERHVTFDSSIVFAHRFQELLGVHVLHLSDKVLEGIGAYFRRRPCLIFRVQQMKQLRIEYLPRIAPRLRQHHAAYSGIGQITKIRAFVNKAPSIRIDHDAERI